MKGRASADFFLLPHDISTMMIDIPILLSRRRHEEKKFSGASYHTACCRHTTHSEEPQQAFTGDAGIIYSPAM